MSENLSTFPCFIQIDQPVQAVQLNGQFPMGSVGIQIDENGDNLSSMGETAHLLVDTSQNPVGIFQEASATVNDGFEVIRNDGRTCVFKVVYPEEFNLSPAPPAKRGRPKKKKVDGISVPEPAKPSPPLEIAETAPKIPRTRSGRLVKLPKHIVKDFKKIEIGVEDQEVKVSDFKRFEEKENTKVDFASPEKKKRTMSAQYKCPRCAKAYLGKSKMIQHLKKNPDHGPLPEGYQQFNFDVWNYLFDITQKCKAGQRGLKFCEELSNLLHNVQLLKSALFKTVTDNKNCVQIDKVLGNAIGLSPGKYKFDENELYKDVTVLKLITNSDFFKPNINKTDGFIANNEPSDLAPVEEDKSANNIGEPVSTDKEIHPNLINETITAKAVDVDNFAIKKNDHLSLASDLLSDNLLISPIANARSSVEELVLTNVESSSTLLDNSASSDEVMNVDQFVNERFKKFLESGIDLSNSSLNLDLPSLDFYSFNNTRMS